MNKQALGLTVFGLILALGGWFAPDISSMIIRGSRTSSYQAAAAYRLSVDWPITRGSVIKCDSRARASHWPWDSAQCGEIAYTYQVKSKQYSSSNIRSGYLNLDATPTEPAYYPDSSRSVDYVQEHYKKGTAVNVHYNPTSARSSYLESAMTDVQTNNGLAISLLGVIMVFGGICAFFQRTR